MKIFNIDENNNRHGEEDDNSSDSEFVYEPASVRKRKFMNDLVNSFRNQRKNDNNNVSDNEKGINKKEKKTKKNDVGNVYDDADSNDEKDGKFGLKNKDSNEKYGSSDIKIDMQKSLVETYNKLRMSALNEETNELEEIRKKEEKILAQVSMALNGPLQSVKERAKGITYKENIKSIWTLPKKYKNLKKTYVDKIRNIFYIDVNGTDIPPPIKNFEDMKLPKPIIKALKKKKIAKPTQIQMQGLPVILNGRDMIGIAFTGSGKTIVFVIPLIMLSLEGELRCPIVEGEGPLGLIVCPSRELATQTHNVIKHFCIYLHDYNYPMLKSLCLIGGVNVYEQSSEIQKGIHMVVATPGRLNDMLNKKKMILEQCKYLCFDEADRLIDLGFEEEVRNTLDHFSSQRQTLLFSATMPKKIQEFAKTTLVNPIIINVGRAGAANLDVIQEVEYVKEEFKLNYLLEVLQKTGPPV
uniref:RNA helicase n=1 Tax=Piliocolobus tephrosceles TaxID=591936 RepID=A0A8C9H0T3_9PRIM